MEQLRIKIIRDLMYSKVKFWSVIDNEYLSLRVLVDTGARITTFSDSALKRLGYITDKKPVTIRTGGGIATANEVTIPKIQIGTVELTNVTAHSNEFLDNFKIKGILGMNVLSQFIFTVNLNDNIIILNRRN
ncbi:MAG: retroviral-like aspartic protease family protein [Oscillospiraceae bacterium]|nr:retroviral-like aspartic protease family protein [Oscillospiraceae bacterium]